MKRSGKFFLFLSMLFFISCEEIENLNIFSNEDDVQLGQEVVAEIQSNPQEYPVYTKNPAVKDYIKTRIFDHLLASPKIAKKNVYKYTIEIIDNDSVYNAFALPGGPVYVYTGILKYLDTEAALAGVLGHEIGHAEERHATTRMTKHYGVSFLLGLLLGQNPSEIAVIAANLFTGIGFLANSRADENESDEKSFEYLKDTRYYPGAVKFFFEQLRDDGLIGGGGSIATFLSTHPDPLERIASTDQRLRNASLPVYDYKSDATGIYRTEYRNNIKNQL
ncbi:MAG: M48 family metalloprotease [Ignavibacteriales bacterium]|nr:M48 family metalloprotease [Ignavibacteriales bacterium]MCF8314602.1 M48 family metalloprotease [Ignavibacteriales bacterium]MCF8436361.1 M48 family metalloprotease [Ignavibacteriales bacterium]